MEEIEFRKEILSEKMITTKNKLVNNSYNLKNIKLKK
jgi:hypothetical protein